MAVMGMTDPAVTGLTSAADPLNTYVLNLTLSAPDQAPAFANRYTTQSQAGPHFSTPQDQTAWQSLRFNTWQNLASSYVLLVTAEQSVLVPGAALLRRHAIASVAVLVGRRLAAHDQR